MTIKRKPGRLRSNRSARAGCGTERRWQLYLQDLGSVLLLLPNFGWIPGTVSNRKRLHLI